MEITFQESASDVERNSPKVTDKSIMKIIYNQCDIKLEQFTQEELA